LIIEQGMRLTKDQMADARRVGIVSPDRIRLMKADQIPPPQYPELQSVARETALLSPGTVSLTLR
jgi:hypothetical protein